MKPMPNSFTVLTAFVVVVGILGIAQHAYADSSKYPQFAQQQLPDNVTPAFIYIDELVAEVKAGTKPLIIDVRSAGEFHETHILGSFSAPLENFASYIATIPKDRLVVLY
jgi:hypothetical protein